MTDPILTPKEQVEAWSKLLKHSAERFDARRGFEWKISLGLWAVLLGLAQFLKAAGGAPVPAWPFALISAVYGLLWLPGLWQASDNDKNLINYSRRQVETLLGVVHEDAAKEFPIKNGGLRHRLQSFKDWSIQFQFAATCCLSSLVWAYTNHSV
jgi:hypothetical protein